MLADTQTSRAALLDEWHTGFLKRCNKLTLDTEHDTIVFFLDESSRIIAHSHCKIDNPNNVMEAMERAKEVRATSVLVGRNVVGDETLDFDTPVTDEICVIRKAARDVRIPVQDYMLVTRQRYASAYELDLI